MKKIITWLFRMAYKKELDQIYKDIRVDGADLRNQTFVESMVSNQSISSRLEILENLNLLDD